MPKRSNEFQRLIHYLYTELVSTGVTVTESAMLQESDGEDRVEREVDILLECEIGGIPLRIAIECRNRTRKDDIEWIDALVGKYSRLDVNKVVAISNSGFSEAALDKAKSHHIETKTLSEAHEANWPAEFVRLGIIGTNTAPRVRAITVDVDPPLQEKVRPDYVVTSGKNDVGSLDDVLKSIRDTKVIPDLATHLRENFLSIYKTVADINRTLYSEHRMEPRDLFLTDTKGVRHTIKAITFEVLSSTSTEKVDVERTFFDGACVTTGVVSRIEDDTPVMIRAVQFKDKPQGKVFVTPLPENKKPERSDGGERRDCRGDR